MTATMLIRDDIELANATDVGCTRTVNEDYFVFIEPQEDAKFSARGRLVVVADGMGGYSGGQIASRIAANSVRDAFVSGDSDTSRDILMTGFLNAQKAIQERAASEPGLEKMGTTCTAAILKQGRLTFAHIGDSRLYLIRDGAARQLTRDHTVVNNMLRDGLITAEQALVHDQRHVLSAALGVGETVGADFPEEPVDLYAGDILLFCSDGLHGLVAVEEMIPVILDQSLQQACAELLAWAKVRSAPDNVTIQLIRINSSVLSRTGVAS
jgi:serine/threonine protein phosphatase PrpC